MQADTCSPWVLEPRNYCQLQYLDIQAVKKLPDLISFDFVNSKFCQLLLPMTIILKNGAVKKGMNFTPKESHYQIFAHVYFLHHKIKLPSSINNSSFRKSKKTATAQNFRNSKQAVSPNFLVRISTFQLANRTIYLIHLIFLHVYYFKKD